MKLDLNIIPNAREALIDQAPLEAAIKELRKTRELFGRRSEFGRQIKRTLNALARRLIRLSQFNIRVVLKCEMLETDTWRVRVLEDLGGEAALRQWEQRKAKADATVLVPRIIPYLESEDDFEGQNAEKDKSEPRPRETVNIPGLEATELKSTRCQTDRDGLFRLAPIRFAIRPDTIQDKFARLEADTWREMMQPLKPTAQTKRPEIFKPIPLTPDELEGYPQTPPPLMPANGDDAKSERPGSHTNKHPHKLDGKPQLCYLGYAHIRRRPKETSWPSVFQ